MIEPPLESPKKVPSSSRIKPCYHDTEYLKTDTNDSMPQRRKRRRIIQKERAKQEKGKIDYPRPVTVHINAIACLREHEIKYLF